MTNTLFTSAFAPILAHDGLDGDTVELVHDALDKKCSRLRGLRAGSKRNIRQRHEGIWDEDDRRIVEMHLMQCLDVSWAIRELVQR